ncbi:MAG: rod shape-determining protein MreC [candidate division Zixibacteria bacterium]|nr:rod shape-determining protein MreC [candidate division Zixibacteria bacterium]
MIRGQLDSIKKNDILLLALLVVLCLMIILIPLRAKETIANITINIFYNPINSVQAKFKGLYAIKEEARNLEAELVEARLKLSYYSDAINENQRLKELLEFNSAYEVKLIPAEIIIRPEIPHHMSVLIGVGAESGVKTDMAVITPDGLAGRVLRVYDKNSEVQLLIDPSSRAASLDVRSRVQGIVKAGPSGGLILDNVPGYEDVIIGDTIRSSGLGGVFPKGIPMGVVANIQQRSSSYLFADIMINPFANFNSLERLFVVTGERK